jgi:nitrogenase delta subunit
MEDNMNDRIEQLVDYIMKKCLWQFNSRAWDREKQNEGIVTKTIQLLCEEPVEVGTPADRCYWVEAKILANNFKQLYPWISTMDNDQVKLLMQGFKERIDYLTITGSLNAEINDLLY